MTTALSARLDAILRLIAPCRMLADIGTDHGKLPIAAVLRGIAEHAIAADLRAAPLRLARRNIDAAGASARVTLVQGDGLQALALHPVDAVVIAGVSGALVVRLITAAPEVLARTAQLVVQPNSDAHLVRAWARAHGWHLNAERIVEEGGRFFVVCAFAKGTSSDPAYLVPGFCESELDILGPLLLARKDEATRRWWRRQRDRILALIDEGAPDLHSELELWQTACEGIEE